MWKRNQKAFWIYLVKASRRINNTHTHTHARTGTSLLNVCLIMFFLISGLRCPRTTSIFFMLLLRKQVSPSSREAVCDAVRLVICTRSHVSSPSCLSWFLLPATFSAPETTEKEIYDGFQNGICQIFIGRCLTKHIPVSSWRPKPWKMNVEALTQDLRGKLSVHAEVTWATDGAWLMGESQPL